jgi:hypothetical protein
MYQRGTLAQFEVWHNAAMEAENIPSPDGKIGYVNGQPAPNRQRTTAYSQVIQHPMGGDDYIWNCGKYCDGDVYTLLEVQDLGWLGE